MLFDELFFAGEPVTVLAYGVRDVWRRADLGRASCCVNVTLAAHASRFLRLTPAKDQPALGACDSVCEKEGACLEACGYPACAQL